MRRKNGRRRRSEKNKTIPAFIAVTFLLIVAVCAVIQGDAILDFLEDFTKPAVKDVDVSGLNSPNAVLISAKGGRVIGEENAKERIYPASLTKMMTAILTLEKRKLSDEITFPTEIFDLLVGSDASQAGYQPGEIVPVKDVVYGILLPSGADCCLAAAFDIAGSEEAFAELMNKKAQRIGMKDTHFVNSTGLHDEEHYSTAYDMALLLKYCLKNKTFREVITAHHYSTGATNLHPDGITVYSTMWKSLSSGEVTGGQIMGGKTGFTNAAGHCLASFAEIDDREYILVTAGASGESGEPLHIYDAVTVYNRVGEAAAERT